VERYRSLTFFFTRDIAEYLTNVLQEILEPLITGKISLKRKLIIVNQPDPDIVASFEALNKFSHKDSAYLRRVTKLRLVELFYLLLGTVYKKDVIAYLLDAAHNDVPSISLTVEEQLYNPVSVEKLAELSGRSLSCFKKEFQHIYGMSPHRWLRTKRLEHAAWLLSTTTRLVEEVADACGFASTTHFTRAFKEKFGLSPRDYRTKQIEFPTL
jgi:AraC-like DNA-binding protein